MSTEQMIRDLAESLEKAGMAKNVFSIVAKHGMTFKSQERPAHITKDTPKECFKNAFLLAYGTGLVYAEGYISVHGIPIHHAWCLDELGNVIDPTIDGQENHEYFGIPFVMEFVFDVLTKSRMYGILDNLGFRKIYELEGKDFIDPRWQKT